MKKSLSALVAAALLTAAAAGAQQIPSTPQFNDEQAWALALQKQISADELSAAALNAEAAGAPDPLLDLATKYNITAPDWLKQRIAAQGSGAVVAAMGDSITAGMASCTFPYYYCPDNSWSTGTLPTSVRTQLAAQSGGDVGAFLVAVPGVAMSFIPAEAYAVFLASTFGLNVERMTLFIGHNDPGVCGTPTSNETQSFGDDYSSALRILAHVAKSRGARLYVGSVTEVPMLARYADLVPNGATKTCSTLWQENGRCLPVTQHVNDPAALAQISAQIATYDGLLDSLSAGQDWVRYADIFNASSRQGLADPAAELSPLDCFHPSVAGQGSLGQLAWQGFGGTPGIADFFGFTKSAEPAPRPAPAVAPGLQAEIDGWRATGARP
jgi:hypothetical protein